MPVDLDVTANEKSTMVVTVSFTDHTGAAVTPNAGLNWTLTDEQGNVVNSRDAVTLTPHDHITIVLHGNDLIALPGSEKLILTIEGTYDSSIGNGLEIKEQASFAVANLIAV